MGISKESSRYESYKKNLNIFIFYGEGFMKIVSQFDSKDEDLWFEKMDSIFKNSKEAIQFGGDIYNIAINTIYLELNRATLDEYIEDYDLENYINEEVIYNFNVKELYINNHLKLPVNILMDFLEENEEIKQISIEDIIDCIEENIEELDDVKEQIIETIYNRANTIKAYIYKYIYNIMDKDNYKVYMFMCSDIKNKEELDEYEEKCYDMYQNLFDSSIGMTLSWISNEFNF